MQAYPNPIQEGHRLANHMQLIKDTQTQKEAPSTMISCKFHMSKSLETIDENHSLHVKLDNQIVLDSELNQESNEELQITPKDVDHQELWEEIRDMKQE